MSNVNSAAPLQIKPEPVVNAAAAANSAQLDAMLGIGTFLTAEEMFLFAESQLKDTDAKINDHIKDINIKKQKAAVLQQISAGLRSVKNGTLTDQMAKVDALIKQAEQAGAPDVVDKLKELKTDLNDSLKSYGWKAVSADCIEGYAQDIDGKMTELTSSTELTMIRVQGLMQHRSQILQLASNVIAALNEPAKNAIGNLRG